MAKSNARKLADAGATAPLVPAASLPALVAAQFPLVSGVALTAPTAGATGIGTGGTYTFVGTDYGTLYGITQASRAVRIYDAAGTTLITTYTTAGAGTTVAVTLTGGPLTVNTSYQAEMVYTDALGNTAVSPKVSFTTATVFKPFVGQAYNGGFLAFENFGDGDLYDLIVAAKSTEAGKAWSPSNTTLQGHFSRLNGPQNSILGVTSPTVWPAHAHALSTSIGGTAGYLGAIDELRAIASKLKPSAATQAAFQTGGAEEFSAAGHWSSTEQAATTASVGVMTTGADAGGLTKTTAYSVRPIRRITVTPPYPIGTAMEGGYLAAYFTDMSVAAPNTFMLIVADKATETTKTWNTSAFGATGITGRTNGITFTNFAASSTAFAAAAYCYDLVSGTKTDWYLGAIDEMLAVVRMTSLLPSGQQITSAQNIFWTSTEVDATNAKYMQVNTLSEGSTAKTGTQWVRPIRRVLLP